MTGVGFHNIKKGSKKNMREVSKMAGFYSEKMIPLLQSIINKADAARAAPSIAEKTEQLLALQNAAETDFAALEKKTEARGNTGMWLIGIGTFTALVTATGVFLSAPIIVPVLGTLVAVGGARLAISSGNRLTQIETGRKNISQMINSEISKILEDHMEEAIQSPLFRQKLKDSFNPEGAPIKALYQTPKNDVRKEPPLPAAAALTR